MGFSEPELSKVLASKMPESSSSLFMLHTSGPDETPHALLLVDLALFNGSELSKQRTGRNVWNSGRFVPEWVAEILRNQWPFRFLFHSLMQT